MKQRIIGIDVARAIAVIGMIIVNFKMAFGKEGSEFLTSLTGVFDGKAAATFVVLAGVGLAFMSNSAVHTKDLAKLKATKVRIFKRALFLFIAGLSYTAIWTADILHFYGVYMLITLFFVNQRKTIILASSASLILIYPLLMAGFEYDLGWNFETFDYSDFWTLKGFLRNTFYNGFHPVLPWVSFMLLGLWFGKQDLGNTKFVWKTLKVSLIIFISTQLISLLSIELLADGDLVSKAELEQVLGTSPMPPLPFYMISGSSIAIFVISACILLTNRFHESKLVDALYKTGQLALTFYIAHVIIGMGAVEVFGDKEMGDYPLSFSVIYALVFSLLCVLFAVLWRSKKESGPLEWLIRKIAG